MANDDRSVRHLIASLRDSEKGFATIGEHMKTPEYKTYFLHESKIRGSYAADLERAVNFTTTGDVHETGTAAGTLHRTLGELLGKIGGDRALLEIAESGEDVAKKAYEEALEDPTISDTIRALIAQQSEHVRRARDTVKAYRHVTK